MKLFKNIVIDCVLVATIICIDDETIYFPGSEEPGGPISVERGGGPVEDVS